MHKLIIPLGLLIGFCWLAQYSYKQAHTPSKESEFVWKKLSEYKRPIRRAEVIADLWNITESDLAKPVNIFAE